MSIGGVVLGVVNIAIVIVVLLLIGAIVLWGLSYIGVHVPDLVQKLYVALIVLVAIYMVVALLLGLPSVSVVPFR